MNCGLASWRFRGDALIISCLILTVPTAWWHVLLSTAADFYSYHAIVNLSITSRFLRCILCCLLLFFFVSLSTAFIYNLLAWSRFYSWIWSTKTGIRILFILLIVASHTFFFSFVCLSSQGPKRISSFEIIVLFKHHLPRTLASLSYRIFSLFSKVMSTCLLSPILTPKLGRLFTF